MQIVKSELIQDAHEQRDGTRWIGEIHTDESGVNHRFDYLATPAMMENREKVMADRAVVLERLLTEVAAESAKKAIVESAGTKIQNATKGMSISKLMADFGLTDDEVAAIRGMTINVSRAKVRR